jgi:hypothetical protein
MAVARSRVAFIESEMVKHTTYVVFVAAFGRFWGFWLTAAILEPRAAADAFENWFRLYTWPILARGAGSSTQPENAPRALETPQAPLREVGGRDLGTRRDSRSVARAKVGIMKGINRSFCPHDNKLTESLSRDGSPGKQQQIARKSA